MKSNQQCCVASFYQYQYQHPIFFIFPFLGLRGGFPSLPRDSTVYTVTLHVLVLRVFHYERCRIRTRDHRLSSLERYQCNEPPLHQRATTSPNPNLVLLRKNVTPIFTKCTVFRHVRPSLPRNVLASILFYRIRIHINMIRIHNTADQYPTCSLVVSVLS